MPLINDIVDDEDGGRWRLAGRRYLSEYKIISMLYSSDLTLQARH